MPVERTAAARAYSGEKFYEFERPTSMAIDEKDGSFYVAEPKDIQVLNAKGEFVRRIVVLPDHDAPLRRFRGMGPDLHRAVDGLHHVGRGHGVDDTVELHDRDRGRDTAH